MHVFDFFKQKLYRKTTNAIDHNYHTCEVRTAILAYSIVILRCDNLFLSLSFYLNISLQITNLAYTFVSFGFYTFPQLLELCALMPELLDYEESLSQHRSGKQSHQYIIVQKVLFSLIEGSNGISI